MKVSHLGFGLFLVASVALAKPAQATQILLDGNVAISDNYNSEAPGTSPVAQTGTWTNPGTPDQVFVTHAASPGPYEGVGYLSLGNNSSGNGAAQLGADISVTAGHTFTFDSEVYVPTLETTTSDDYQFSARGSPGNSGGITFLTTIENGTVYAYYNSGSGAAYHPTGTTITGNEWQDWKIVYTAGSPTFSWTIDGSGDTSIPVYNGGSSSSTMGSFILFSNYGTQQSIFLDQSASSIPEPASLTALGIPAIGLVMRRRRR
jgi:hypothetical protein